MSAEPEDGREGIELNYSLQQIQFCCKCGSQLQRLDDGGESVYHFRCVDGLCGTRYEATYNNPSTWLLDVKPHWELRV